MLRLAAILVLVSVWGGTDSARAQGPARPYTQLYVFGDSYSDSGAGFAFSDGPAAVVYLAQRLSIPFTYYGDANAKGKGLNFAVSGAKTGTDPGVHDPMGFFRLGMKNQVQEFAALVKSGAVRFDPAQTMFFLAGGLNDGNMPLGYTRANLEDEIDTLYGLGARRFMVALLPVKIPDFDRPARMLNPDIARIPGEERAKHAGIRIANSDWGPFFDEVITHPANYGLTDTTSICMGHPRDGSPDPCLSPQTHFYYRGGHPSTAAHKAVGEMLYREALTKAD